MDTMRNSTRTTRERQTVSIDLATLRRVVTLLEELDGTEVFTIFARDDDNPVAVSAVRLRRALVPLRRALEAAELKQAIAAVLAERAEAKRPTPPAAPAMVTPPRPVLQLLSGGRQPVAIAAGVSR
jgi:hypothetical protein